MDNSSTFSHRVLVAPIKVIINVRKIERLNKTRLQRELNAKLDVVFDPTGNKKAKDLGALGEGSYMIRPAL